MAYEKTNWTSTTPINATNLNKIENGIKKNNNDINNMVNVIYPIGSIYMSINSTNPETLFGGTWEQIKDTFLLSAGDTYEAGSTGGEDEHTLTIDEMPKHSHKMDDVNYGGYANRLGIRSDGGGGTGLVPSFSHTNSYSTYVPTPTGGGLPHNNMPPYLTVYMWKRTA